jgi:hypothetical protein
MSFPMIISLRGLSLLGAYSIYKNFNPSLDDLKDIKRVEYSQIQLDQMNLERQQKQREWKDQCLIKNRILEY